LGVLGFSADGSYIYFVADGVLAPGASHSSCRFSNTKCNLYVYHDGVTKFITRLSRPERDYRVSADGSAITFPSNESLTGYNNVGCNPNPDPNPCKEFFRYSAPEEKLLCVTCLPTGVPPKSFVSLGDSVTGLFVNSNGASGGPPSNLSANGNRFFFNTREAMVPGDTNGVTDVYEWEAKGEGSCESESQNGGCIYLISSGTDPSGSGFLDASKNGDHAFFFTEQHLVPGDEDQLFDVYDAGIGAGLAAQHALAPPTCAGTACQANPPPPPDPSLASAAYSGPGNAHAGAKGRKCPKGSRKVRQGGKARCRRARHHKRAHKRHANRANANRGGSK
jgi:hypothetical protein